VKTDGIGFPIYPGAWDDEHLGMVGQMITEMAGRGVIRRDAKEVLLESGALKDEQLQMAREEYNALWELGPNNQYKLYDLVDKVDTLVADYIESEGIFDKLYLWEVDVNNFATIVEITDNTDEDVRERSEERTKESNFELAIMERDRDRKTFPRGDPGTGMENPTVLCYANSLIQVFAHIPALILELKKRVDNLTGFQGLIFDKNRATERKLPLSSDSVKGYIASFGDYLRRKLPNDRKTALMNAGYRDVQALNYLLWHPNKQQDTHEFLTKLGTEFGMDGFFNFTLQEFSQDGHLIGQPETHLTMDCQGKLAL
jgi:hypothetical protein